MTARRLKRDALIRGIQIAARIHDLRRLAAQTTEVFSNGQRAGWSSDQVAARMLMILSEQQAHDNNRS
jgi:hypothetical protein